MGPFVGPRFGATFLRDPAQDGLLMPSLLGGYAVIAFVVALAVHARGASGMAHGAWTGLWLGLGIFFGGHLVVAGWSKMPFAPMAVSGLLDALSVAVGGAVFARLASWQKPRHVHAD